MTSFQVNPSNSTDDKLLLSLSHAPLPTPLLDRLVDQTSVECVSMLDIIKESGDNFVPENKDENSPRRNKILHVLTTGCPYVIKPGKSQPDYIQQWTKGEKILARLVDKIGMEKFHRVPKDGEAKLAGRLIDVKPSDFEFILNNGNNDGRKSSNNDRDEFNKENSMNMETPSSASASASTQKKNDHTNKWRDDCLSEELSWIANNILSILIIDNRPKIGHAKILFPLDPRFEHVNHAEILCFVEGVFRKEWAMKDGPLQGADVEVLIVESA